MLVVTVVFMNRSGSAHRRPLELRLDCRRLGRHDGSLQYAYADRLIDTIRVIPDVHFARPATDGGVVRQGLSGGLGRGTGVRNG